MKQRGQTRRTSIRIPGLRDAGLRFAGFGLVLCLWLGAPVAASAGDSAEGKALFKSHCSSCHGASGRGDGPASGAFKPPLRDLRRADFRFDPDADGRSGSDGDLKLLIENGAGVYGGSYLMAPSPDLSDRERDDIVSFIRSLRRARSVPAKPGD